MNRYFIVIACLFASACAFGSTDPVLKPALFHTVYVPGGFDSNDNVQFVGEGLFRNTCYRPAPTTVAVDQVSKTITVDPVAYEYPALCLQVILPFDRVIDIGVLSPGQYSVFQNPGGEKLGTIQVAPAQSLAPDDYLYAPITQAFFKQRDTVSEFTLTGDLPNNCMAIDEVKVTVEAKVIVLQPIAKLLHREDCVLAGLPFSTTVKVEGIPKGRYLLHVRSMNAKAVNTLIDVR